MKTVIIDYGAGNVFSVQQALVRLGVESTVTDQVDEIISADRIILPGVGHAKPAMEQLEQQGLWKVIPTLEQPFLGICLGMQLLCAHNEEAGGSGLGIFDTTVSLFDTPVIIPHMGWNDVRFEDGKKEAFYFVHSFKAALCGDTWGICDYGDKFSAALRKNNFYGVQFHPEKSGPAGAALLETFLKNN